MTQSFPRQQARTRRFRLGAPSHFVVSDDGARIAFTRSGSGTDPINRLFVVDVGEGVAAEGEGVPTEVGRSEPTEPTERLVADPLALLATTESLSATERARRERLRETTGGITAFGADPALRVAALALSGQLGLVELGNQSAAARLVRTTGDVVDPRVDPTGRQVAWVSDGALWCADIDGARQRVLVSPEADSISWGLADFIAAEELNRFRGYWWSPDGSALLVARVDEGPVDTWWRSDPASPNVEPTPARYPAAGTANADVSLWLVDLTGTRRRVAFAALAPDAEYLAAVRWTARGDALAIVLNRAQTVAVTIAINADGSCREVARTRCDPWTDVLPGSGQWFCPTELAEIRADAATDTWRLALAGRYLTPAGLQVRELLDVADDGFLIAASREPTQCQVLHVDPLGKIIEITATGWASAVRGGDVIVASSINWGDVRPTTTLLRWSPGTNTKADTDEQSAIGSGSVDRLGSIESFAHTPTAKPQPQLLRAGEHELRTVVQWPSDHTPGSARLPVLLNPYGGPHAQRVVASGRAYCETQWLADQGFCVVVADGRGSPGRGPEFEHSISGDLAGPVLADQIEVLHEVAAHFPDDIDLGRVAITGWSFGGYLAALAVLTRPDVFHAAVAGAPVTDWRLYDTAYTERYLGNPNDDPTAYERCSLLELRPTIKRPLLIIHGLADDNVVVAHSLRLSAALTAAGHPHSFLPLVNVTHMTPQEEVAENLLLLQVDFLHRALRSEPDQSHARVLASREATCCPGSSW